MCDHWSRLLNCSHTMKCSTPVAPNPYFFLCEWLHLLDLMLSICLIISTSPSKMYLRFTTCENCQGGTLCQFPRHLHSKTKDPLFLKTWVTKRVQFLEGSLRRQHDLEGKGQVSHVYFPWHAQLNNKKPIITHTTTYLTNLICIVWLDNYEIKHNFWSTRRSWNTHASQKKGLCSQHGLQ